MRLRPKVGVLPLGELTAEEIQNDMQAALQNISKADMEIVIRGPTFGPLETIRVAKELSKQDIDLLIVIPLHGVTAEQQVLAAENCKVPTVIWTLPVRFSLPSGAIGHGALRDRGFRVKMVYGRSDSEEVVKKIESIARVALTINELREARIGTIGGVFKNIVTAHYDKNTLREKIGPDVTRINIVDVKNALDKIEVEEVNVEARNLYSRFRVEVSDERLKKALKFHIALRNIAKQLDLQGLTFECWSEFIKEFGTNPCLGFVDDSYTISCEGDAVSLAALLMLRYLTGKPAVLLDVLSLQGDVLSMGGHCAAPAIVSTTSQDVLIGRKEPPAIHRMAADLATCRPTIPWKEVTIMRLFGRSIDKIHLTTGEIVECDNRQAVEVKVKLKGDVDKFMDHICSNHYIIAEGDLRTQISLLCDWLSIELIVD